MVYIYDESGSPIGIQYRHTAYSLYKFDSFFFEKNLQGDVIAIYNELGEQIGAYFYDAWGNHTIYEFSTNTPLENSILNTYNPFRYRSYFYDVETELYYLQTRYYNPVWGRFLNVDSYLNANGDIIGHNMYAYCSNNPVMYGDDTGQFLDIVFDVLSLAGSIVEVVKNPSDPMNWVALAGDIADVAIPCAGGVGETTRAIATAGKAAKKFEKAQEAVKAVDNLDGAIDTYKALRKVNKGSGLEVHHIVEKRFADALGIKKESEMLSIALDHDQHQVFTQAWRTAIPYGSKYKKDRIWEVAQDVYANYPQLLEAARKTIFGG